jgi:hypothetical protein
MKKLFPFLVLLLFSCKKDDCSSELQTINQEEYTVVVGWPINLKTNYISTTVTNKWSGPNNWQQTTSEGISELKITDQSTFSDAGNYQVESYSYTNCLLQKKNIQVHIIDPPHAPCSIDMNTSHISSPFIYETTYNQVTSYISDGYFVIKAQNGFATITFNFYGTQEPKPGIHQGLLVEFSSDQTPYNYYRLDSNQKIFLQKINNQLVISFCNAVFYNPGDIDTDVIITGEIIVS